jgi:hypothetical protein
MSIAENVPASVRLGNDILFGNIDAFGKAFERAQRNIKEFFENQYKHAAKETAVEFSVNRQR